MFWHLYLRRWSWSMRLPLLLLEGNLWPVRFRKWPGLVWAVFQFSQVRVPHGETLVIRSPWSVVVLCRKAGFHHVSGQWWFGETEVHLTWWELGCSCGTQCLDVLYAVFKRNRNSLPFRSTSLSHFHDTECQMFSKWASNISAALHNEIVLRSFFPCGFLGAPGVSDKS